MAKDKKKKADQATTPSPTAESDPLACLRLPANPPKPNITAFVIAIGLFLLWFGYLVVVAYFG